MKFLVVLVGVLATVCRSEPIETDYTIPVAPPVTVVETVTIPEPPPAVVEQRFVPLAHPLVRSPVHVLSQSPFAVAGPVPLAARVPVATPFAAHPVPLAAAPAPVPVPTPLVAQPVPLPVRAAPAVVPVPAAAPVVPLAAPVPVSTPNSQFHAQDELGGFSFGYQNLNSAKQEVRDHNGVTRGQYSYIDANGLPQHVEYVSDPVHGFRVAATNLPVGPEAAGPISLTPVQDTPEVVAARLEFQRAFDEAVARDADAIAEAAVAKVVAKDSLESAALIVKNRKKRSLTNDYQLPEAPVITVIPTEPLNPAVTLPAPAPGLTPAVVQVARVAPVPHPVPVAAPFVRAPIPFAPISPLVARAPIAPVPVAPLTPLVPAPAPVPAVKVIQEPVVAAAAPVVPLPAVQSTQFQAQDEAGGFSFGYANDLSTRQESRTPDGVTRGSYSYVDANGVLQEVHYTADPVNGFQVRGTNLPQAPVLA